jgi:ribosomal protein L18E
MLNTIKKHQKAILIGGGVLAALYLLRGKNSVAAPLTSATAASQIRAISGVHGSLGSLE